jgi:hypothetical protein
MPIYEFYCPDNNKIYQFLARTLSLGGKVPRCPENAAYKLQKRVSRFAFVKGLKEDAGNDPLANIDDAKMEALMAEMERDMGGMDEANPDPRQLGHLMRKMTDVMGDKVPAEMREMIRRLESGEDPEKLEAEFGDLGEDGESQGGDLFSQTVKKIKAGFRAPTRDPKLYEMSEFV